VHQEFLEHPGLPLDVWHFSEEQMPSPLCSCQSLASGQAQVLVVEASGGWEEGDIREGISFPVPKWVMLQAAGGD
jgi:hypothetical protein